MLEKILMDSVASRFRGKAWIVPTVKPERDEKAQWIVAIARERDSEIFAQLFLYFAPRVKSHLLRLNCSESEAEDLAQETLLSVWRKADRFDPERAAASTWIFTIARNLRVDAARRARTAQKDQLLWSAETDDSAPPASDGFLAAESCAHVKRALEALPTEQADIVRLSFFEEKPHSDIARLLGIPLGTVKSRLRLAMARLRAAMGNAS